MSEKRTVLFHVIDGHRIITGFDRPTVDGVATTAAVKAVIADTDEYKAAEAKKAEYMVAVNGLNAIKNQSIGTNHIPRESQERWNTLLGTMQVRQNELRPIAADLEKKIAELRVSEAVHFEPRAGEQVIQADEAVTLSQLIKGKAADELVTVDGSTVKDSRGKVYYRKASGKWGRTQICNLGDAVPGDAVTEPSEAEWGEIEVDRVSSLTADVRAREREKVTAAAMASAAAMKSELEIKSDPEALSKSQAWYSDEMARIGGLYG